MNGADMQFNLKALFRVSIKISGHIVCGEHDFCAPICCHVKLCIDVLLSLFWCV